MDAAKASVQKMVSDHGKHDTTVHERTAPAVQNETISQKQHERHIPVINREVHQDHYHTTEQPVHHQETLPEQHHHREIPIEKREFEHDDHDRVKRGLEDERAKYKDTQTRVDGEKTRSTEAAVVGERKHHHVYENIQPVVHKQTVEPHVVHTTIPVHEVHHNETQHHSATSLPPVSMEDFKKQGGTLQGRDEKRDFFPGEPKSMGNKPPGGGSSGGLEMNGHGNETKQSNIDPATVGRTGRIGSHSSSSSSDQEKSLPPNPPTHSSGTTSSNPPPVKTYGPDSSSTTSAKKPSLLDKLNPKKDADGDGKAGFMK